jgi:hypothetical protein
MSLPNEPSQGKSNACGPLTIDVFPASDSIGRFAAWLNGRRLCVSRQPFVDSARILIGEGHGLDAILEMRRHSAPSWDMRATVGMAAQLDVAETPYGPKFVRHRPPVKPGEDCNRSAARAFAGQAGVSPCGERAFAAASFSRHARALRLARSS